MCRSLFACWLLGLFVVTSGVRADMDPAVVPALDQVAAAYMAGDFEKAFVQLASVPGLLGVAPVFDQPEPEERARLFFDLGRIRLAAGDTARARVVLGHVFVLNPQTDKGLMHVPADPALHQTRSFLASLRKQAYNRKLRLASRGGGAFRSLLLPGWGQMYRGHKKRGYVFMSVAAGLAAFWAISDQLYRSAYRDYRKTRIEDLALGNRLGMDSDPLPFKARFERAESRARRANLALGMLAAVWLGNVFDNLVVGPAQLSITMPIR